MPSLALLIRFWREGVIGLLCLALAFTWVLKGQAENRAEREKINANELRAELKVISDARNRQRIETDKRIEQADKGRKDAETIAQRIERAPTSEGCVTAPEVMRADL